MTFIRLGSRLHRIFYRVFRGKTIELHMHECSSVVAGTVWICLVHMMTDLPSLVDVKERSEVSTAAPGSTRRPVRGALALALVVAASWLGYAVAFYRGLDHLHFAAQQRLAVEAARLDGYLSRFEYLPSLLETSPNVFRLLDAPRDPALQQTVSLYLKSINLLAGADNLYVLGVSGEALAAADFEQPGTPVDRNLSYRPYMSEALANGRGAFFGVGITSARAGYYLSYALKDGGTTRGSPPSRSIWTRSNATGGNIENGVLTGFDERRVAILSTRGRVAPSPD